MSPQQTVFALPNHAMAYIEQCYYRYCANPRWTQCVGRPDAFARHLLRAPEADGVRGQSESVKCPLVVLIRYRGVSVLRISWGKLSLHYLKARWLRDGETSVRDTVTDSVQRCIQNPASRTRPGRVYILYQVFLPWYMFLELKQRLTGWFSLPTDLSVSEQSITRSPRNVGVWAKAWATMPFSGYTTIFSRLSTGLSTSLTVMLPSKGMAVGPA